ncbi:hypothetical protein PSAB_16105 [Paenibacillus sabinae T27]|uniref:Uncharacterized protein n=1 Tax=Paenibacillus sabinae T27 TaxID=1268072 RepID=X5A167_9BACL|nr:hypothetical protein PSAB_16105 [Paenibacillus sabinae T27]
MRLSGSGEGMRPGTRRRGWPGQGKRPEGRLSWTGARDAAWGRRLSWTGARDAARRAAAELDRGRRSGPGGDGVHPAGMPMKAVAGSAGSRSLQNHPLTQ